MYDNDLLDLLGKSQRESLSVVCEKLAFIENKPVDYEFLQKTLSLSKDINHWANFGPVSRLLESALCTLMAVSDDKTVVVCKSGTEALHAIVRLHEARAERELRWVCCAFGFISTNIGPLAKARLVDCNQQGMLCLDELKKLDLDSWDGLVVTNIFGLCQDMVSYRDYCHEHGKVLVVDAATALLTSSRTIEQPPDEAISFHQTKPWGMGEGGAAIIDQQDEADFRSLLNFGVGSSNNIRWGAVNGKLSDFCSALIYQRVGSLPSWQPLYKRQSLRVEHLASMHGLKMLAPAPAESILAHLPLLAPFPVSKLMLENSYVFLRKYYSPLADGYPMALDIFSRMVNFPCHSQVDGLEDSQIEDIFIGLSEDRAATYEISSCGIV
jgi:dTDP-4-amino-4,6-dideoxygalactose transaminase